MCSQLPNTTTCPVGARFRVSAPADPRYLSNGCIHATSHSPSLLSPPIATPSCHQMPTTTHSNVSTNHSEPSGIDRNHSEPIGTCSEVLRTDQFHSVPLGTCGAQKSTDVGYVDLIV